MTADDFIRQKQNEIWDWQVSLSRLGPRFTGNEAHRQFIDWIGSNVRKTGLEYFSDSISFQRWEARSCRLSVLSSSGAEEEIPVSFYYPYSGSTSSSGITGELCYCRNRHDLKKAAGKIAVLRVSNPLLPTRLLFHLRKKRGREFSSLPFLMRHPVVSTTLFGPDLALAEKYGVSGIICILEHSTSETSDGQYLPFTTPLRNCPSVWVTEQTGLELIKKARRHMTVRLLLDAFCDPNAVSETLYTILPGLDPQKAVLINTHTDGPNACEENGALALLSMLSYFSSLSVQERPFTLIFLFATGHFQLPQFGIRGGQAASRWLHDHPELWDGAPGHIHVTAGLTLEHLGCMQQHAPRRFSSQPALFPEPELIYTSDPYLDGIYHLAAQSRTLTNTITLKPWKLFFGEGEPLYQMSVPVISLVPAPGFLCAVSESGYLERLSPELFCQQTVTFCHIIELLWKND